MEKTRRMLAEAVVAFRSQFRPGVFSLSTGRKVLHTYIRYVFQGAFGEGLKIDSGQMPNWRALVPEL